jgi:hypothetical protein
MLLAVEELQRGDEEGRTRCSTATTVLPPFNFLKHSADLYVTAALTLKGPNILPTLYIYACYDPREPGP